MNIESLKKLKETLGTKETYQLIGEICRAYEFLRYNGTKSHIKAIYDIKDNYDGLNDDYIYDLMVKLVLIDEIESGDLISIS